MSWLERLRSRLFGYGQIEPEGVMPEIKHIETVPRSYAQENGENSHVLEANQRILFVCSGNICRSAYGAVKFEALLAARGLSMCVASAGTLRIVGQPAAVEMIATAQERGLDLTRHRSSALSKPLIDAADVIFVMEHGHRQEIERMCPDRVGHVIMLGSCLPEPKAEIRDPMGEHPHVYREVADEIDVALEHWISKCENHGKA